MTTNFETFDGGQLGAKHIRVSHLLHAALILLALNVLIILWFSVSSSFASSNRTSVVRQDSLSEGYKQSPFETIAVPVARKAVRAPQRLAPVIEESTPVYSPAFGVVVQEGN